MAHRPKRTFRQRRADSSDSDSDSDSDSAEEPSAEPGAPGEQAVPGPEEEGPPHEGDRAEAAERPLRARGPRGRGRGRGRVWATSRRAAGAAPRADGGAGVPECTTVDLSTDEEDGTYDASESKDDQSSPSDSSSSLEEEFSSIVNIPDAAFIQAARRKRELARAQEDYISLDVKHISTIADTKKDSDEDPESEPDDHEKRIPFTLKPQTLKQRMAEEITTRNEESSEESQEDEKQAIWEEQQMRKAVKITKGRNIDLSHSSEFQTVKKFDTSISFPPVNLEIIKKQINRRLTLLQDTHRSHQREYEKYVEDVKSSKNAIQNLENSSDQALNFKFYKSMKIYVDNLIDCLNEKIINIQEIESSMHALLLKQAMTFMKRRQDELKHESTYLQQLSRKAETSTNGSLAIDEKTQCILEGIESRRAQRRQARALSGNCDHQEGTSSDDELSSADMADFQKSQGDILQDHKKIFEDVNDDFSNIQNILLKFQQWREKFPDSYYEAFIGLCIPKLLNPLIRVQLINWNPLKFNSIGLKQMPWFTSIENFIDNSMQDSKKEDNSDKKILSAVINKTVIPRLTDFVEFIWDPLSTSQTTSLVDHCRMILEEHSTCENEISKGRQDLVKSIVSRMKKAIEDDVYIPLYPKSTVENKTSPHSKFQERQFWSAVKGWRVGPDSAPVHGAGDALHTLASPQNLLDPEPGGSPRMKPWWSRPDFLRVLNWPCVRLGTTDEQLMYGGRTRYPHQDHFSA
ncbi:intron Large complex component GCFC2 isoform X2 [Pipistrellus kuhlii]|uniref:intron Large complex component GCFC2 isoform X2 n=1 Tax=Pipistrellus kuhlii TaxID=59472 RepID=UPI00174EE946|nr:intron Large complex component GCFC2 isoform X2 [Pipistrellus kuhlii]